ncbi:type II secretion system major pseudopilin GspG [Myxococcus qinghaiensis]|uniref:type II secretion system major pseudopilin GspG n=1 Tax=Myxococcus qinghaiensis TaxID=2906758 RepID=UPI0020A807E6|nr:type II secretion system major pseudopilin GspG [Myxococcus qinghaiensis]MCP3162163.1 type II secretion system major pseudopilin GspG [Myxococcus qinghaiensis]
MNPNKSKQHRRRHRGMTLIEIMVVITILGLIATAVGVSVMDSLKAAKKDKASLDIKALETALKLHYTKTGHFPDTQAGLGALVESRALEQLPKDPWQNDYVYLNEGGRPVVISYGADGAAGGEGDDADISSTPANSQKG